MIEGQNLKILNKPILSIISLITGIIGFFLSTLSFFLPWYLINYVYSGNYDTIYHIYFYPMNLYQSFYSLLFGNIFGLLMIIIMILSWKKEKVRIFSSLMIIGILSLTLIIESAVIFYKFEPSAILLAIYTRIYKGYSIGFYLNLIAIIFIIFMIGFSFLGYFIFERPQKGSRKQEISEIQTQSLFNLSFLTLIVILFNLPTRFYDDSYFYTAIRNDELSLILVTTGMLSITIIDPKNHIKSLISSFLIISLVMIILRQIISLEYWFRRNSSFLLTIPHFFFYEIILILIFFSFIFFEKVSKTTKKPIQENRKNSITKIIYLFKILNCIPIILLVYLVLKWVFNGEFEIIPITGLFPMFLLAFYLIYLLFILSIIIYCYKDSKPDLIKKNLSLMKKIQKRKLSRINNFLSFTMIFLLTIYIYLILKFFNIIPEDWYILIWNDYSFSRPILYFPESFILFIILHAIAFIIILNLQILKFVRLKTRLTKKRELNILSN
ncbi:MAG: hypothetical protein ACFE9T_15605 [Promethearchaeota archaeon]